MAHVLSPYRDVLRTPGAWQFSAAGALARLPISMVGIGTVLMVSTLYGDPGRGDYALAGRVSAVYIVAGSIASPQLARLVDRYGQARVMRPSILVSAVALVTLMLLATTHFAEWGLWVAGAVTGCAMGSMGALVRARWSNVLTDGRQLHTAYSLEAAVDEVVFIVGPVLATVLATALFPQAGLMIPVAAMLGGGYWFLSMRSSEPPARPLVPDAARQRTVLRHPGMVVLALVFAAVGAIFGATDVATVAFAEEHGSKGSAGAILAVFATGSLLSGLAYGARHWASPLWRRFTVGVLLLAVGVCPFFLVTSIPMLAAVMFVTGFAIAPTLVNGNALVQQFVAPGRLTEGLSWVGTSLGVGVSIGASAGGALIQRGGARGGYLVVVMAGAAAVLATVLSLRTLRSETAEVPLEQQQAPTGPTTDPTA